MLGAAATFTDLRNNETFRQFQMSCFERLKRVNLLTNLNNVSAVPSVLHGGADRLPPSRNRDTLRPVQGYCLERLKRFHVFANLSNVSAVPSVTLATAETFECLGETVKLFPSSNAWTG